MSQENIEKVRRAYEAFNRGDLEGMLADFEPESEYIASGAIPGARGVYRGAEGFRRLTEMWWGEFADARIEIRDLIDADDQVVAALTYSGSGKGSGVDANWDHWHVWSMRDGKVMRGQGFTSEAEALEAAGLRE